MGFVAVDTAEPGTFDAIFNALENDSRSVIGHPKPRLLVIPIHDDAGRVIGGLWGTTMLRWLQVAMLFVPGDMRGQGVGTNLMAAAEAEARRRTCIGIQVDTLSFQAVPFYQKLGFAPYGVLDDCPPGHQRVLMQKRLS